MLIKFFKSSFLIQYIAIVFISAALWIPGILHPMDLLSEPGMTTPIYNLAHLVLVFTGPYNPIIAYFIVLISGFTLNNILVYHDLTPKNNLLPAFIFILLFSSDPEALNVYPLILTFPFFTWLIHTVFRVNDEPENNLAVFNASMILSVITLIYFPAVFLFIFLWLLLPLFGIFSGRNIIITLIGFFLPYVYLAFYYFWTDNLVAAGEAYLDFFRVSFRIQTGSDYLQYGIWGYLLFLMILPAFFKITSTLSSYGIKFRKKMAATNWLLVISLPMIILNGEVNLNLLVLFPASIVLSHYYNIFKKSLWNEIILLLFLFIIGIHNYLHI